MISVRSMQKTAFSHVSLLTGQLIGMFQRRFMPRMPGDGLWNLQPRMSKAQ